VVLSLLIPPFGREFSEALGIYRPMKFILGGHGGNEPRPVHRFDEPHRAISWQVALQQSPPLFHLAVVMLS
jgi:hypothetical protein